MASKKNLILAFFVCFLSIGAFAQMAGTIDFLDSSKYNSKKMAQYNEWANGLPSAPFAPKPRDAWQLGVLGGYYGVFGDVNTAAGFQFGVSARKALGYMVSVRPAVTYGKSLAIGYEKGYSLRNLPQDIQEKYRAAGLTSYVHQAKIEMITPSVDLLFSLNNIMFHKKQSNTNVYLLLGYAAVIYNTHVEALDGNGNPHTYTGVDFSAKRSDIIDQLKSYYDANGGRDYETKGYVRPRRNNFNDPNSKYNLRHSWNMGAGLERRLGDIVSLGAEFKYTNISDDWVDGYAVGAGGVPTPENDKIFAGNLYINFNLGLKSRKKAMQASGKDESKSNQDLGQFPGKRVAPLWMHNPLGHPYGELANPTRMNMPKGWLEDSDSDGVPDQFDLEPNTPAGAPVDSRGRTRDTDGDGVPDYLDKELITPSYCQPVNADGIGKCPDPACCTAVVAPPSSPCNIGSLPSVQFASGKSGLTSSATAILDAAAEQIKANPNCKICVVGHGGSSKREQQLSWDRVNSVINYLNESKGISRDRFVFKYGEAGDPNTVDLQDCTGEEGPNNVPPPHPQYRTTK